MLKMANNEMWKQIEIDGKLLNYEISSLGNIRNMNTKQLMTLNNRKDNYTYYTFRTKDFVKTVRVHKLVADAFLKPPDNPKCIYIDHKNMNKHDNCVDNLEWVTHSENVKRAHQDENRVSTGRQIEQWDFETKEYVQTFNSIREAAHTLNVSEKNFSSNLSGRTNYINTPSGKFYFNYVEPKVTLSESELSEFEQLNGYTDYLIHRDGRIYNTSRKMFLKSCVDKGYISVKLNGITTILHRLLAIQFVPNPENKVNVIHIDGDKLNNDISNLRWANKSEMCLQSYTNGTNPPKTSNVHQYSLDGKYIKTFSSIAHACKELNLTNSQSGDVTKCCQRKSKYAHGFIWRYASDCSDTIDIEPVIAATNVDKSVVKLDRNTGAELETYKSLSEAAESLGLERRNFGLISNCCKNKCPSAYGYRWKFV